MTSFGGQVRWRTGSGLRAALCLALLGLLSACGTNYQASSEYGIHRRGDYAPPGPPEDPWGPYINEASGKYHIPSQWVRAVMRQESGGREYLNGQPITSNAGAMGLMQVMPSTYATLADRYGLGGDPYDPHDNIMAGAAYLREMYEEFGSPGFLAAYNAGPGRVHSHLVTGNPLPSETQHYVASIAPHLGGDSAPSGSFAYASNDRSTRAYQGGGAVGGGVASRSSGSIQMASIAANPGGRSAAQEAAWQTSGQSAFSNSPSGIGQSGGAAASGGSIQLASIAANPGGRSAAEEAAWQTSGQGSGPAAVTAAALAPVRSPADEAAWQTASGRYSGSPAQAFPMPSAPPPAAAFRAREPSVQVASAEAAPPSFAPRSFTSPSYGSRSPVPYGGTQHNAALPVPQSPAPGGYMTASAQAGELPPSMRYHPAMPPPSHERGVLGTLPIGRSSLPEPPPPPPRIQFASVTPGAARVYGGSGGSGWTIQVGAYANPGLAHSMAENARHLAPEALRGANTSVGPVATAGGGTLYRARLSGLSSSAASAACSRLAAGHMTCAAMPPNEKW